MNNGTLDTRNAADSTNYNLTIYRMWVYGATGILKLRDGTHTFNYSNGQGLYISDYGSTVTMDGCTVNHTGARLKGKLTATGTNTMNWGYGADVNITDTNLEGGGEGNFNGTDTWEYNSSRIKWIIDQSGMSSRENIEMVIVEQDSLVDDDGPFFWRWNQMEIDMEGQELILMDYTDHSAEWSYDNGWGYDIGAGGHSISGEGNFTLKAGTVQMARNHATGIQGALRIRGNCVVGTGSGTKSSVLKPGQSHSSNDNRWRAYIRIDGNFHLNAGSAGTWQATAYLPIWEHYDPGGFVTDANSLKGAFMCFGTVTSEGILRSYDAGDGRKQLWVLGKTGGAWNIALGGFDGVTSDGYWGQQDGDGYFNYDDWQELAISEQNPSGISLGTKPDGGGDSIIIKHYGGTEGSELRFGTNAGFANITIDSGASIRLSEGVAVTYSGTFTNNGTLNDAVDDGSGTINYDAGETKSHSAFGRGDGGKTSFQFEAAQDLDQSNWIENYFLDQDNRLG